MKKKVKKLWVDALNGGSYKQGKFSLHQNGEFCVLGVLCDLHAKEKGGAWTQILDGSGMYEGMTAILPDSVMKWAGLDRRVPLLTSPKNPDDVLDMVVLNDGGATFAQLAELIDAQL